ncbi:MAG TPA: NUDIX hydrolase [Streptosporangiaceae bacterium]|nr:NUDIX hydrolase [Streptosporangiaceae bacterium]
MASPGPGLAAGSAAAPGGAVTDPDRSPPRDERDRWPVSSSAELASGRLLRMVEDQVRMPDGTVAGREYIEHPGAVGIVALDEHGRVLLIRQYRHPPGAQLWEIPAGLRDVSGEPLEITARRELLEETGYLAADWRVLADFFSSPGCSTERLRVFLARGLTEAPAEQRTYVPEHEEAFLTLRWVPLDEAVQAFIAGDLHNGVAGVGILSAYAARRDDFAELRPAGAPEGP